MPENKARNSTHQYAMVNRIPELGRWHHASRILIFQFKPSSISSYCSCSTFYFNFKLSAGLSKHRTSSAPHPRTWRVPSLASIPFLLPGSHLRAAPVRADRRVPCRHRGRAPCPPPPPWPGRSPRPECAGTWWSSRARSTRASARTCHRPGGGGEGDGTMWSEQLSGEYGVESSEDTAKHMAI